MSIPTLATTMPTPSCGCSLSCNGDFCPVDLATGGIEYFDSFLQTIYGSFDIAWFNLYRDNSGNAEDRNRNMGFNWSSRQMAYYDILDDDSIRIIFAPGRGGTTYWFEKYEDKYQPLFGCHAQMTIAGVQSTGELRLVEEDGTVTLFDTATQLIKSQTSPDGIVTTYKHDTNNLVSDVQREHDNGSLTIESRKFDYDSSNLRLQYVTLRRNTTQNEPYDWSEIRRVEFVYYTSDVTNKGNTGDVKYIKEQLYDSGTSSWVDDKIRYFRYYTASESNGYKHGLKLALSPEGYKRLANAVSVPEAASDATLAEYASHYFQYDDTTRQATRSDVAGGQISNTISYALNPRDPTLISTNWVRKAVMTTPDGSTKTVYSNNAGQDLLVDHNDGSDHWITYTNYNSDYRVIEFVHPSAIDMTDPYDDGDDDLAVNIKASGGLVDVTTYYTETDNDTGKVAGYPEFRKVRKGTSTTEFDVSKSEYNERSDGGSPETTVTFLTKQTVYRSESGDPIDTSFSHQWEANTVHLEKLTTTLPEIQSGENPVGDTSSDTIVEDYDSQGRLFKSTDARGTITEYEYDDVTGAQIQMTQDPGTGNLDLITDRQVDDLGRVTQSLGPVHDINGTNVRTASWTVYLDDEHEIWIARGFNDGTDDVIINPVTIQKMDLNGRVVDVIEATIGTGVERTGALDPDTDSFDDQTKWVRWTKTIYGNGGRMTATRVYHLIPDSGNGASGTNYDETTYAYDSMGRQNRVQKPNGTITRTVFDVRGLVDSVWIGTDDTDATDTDPTGGSATGNNMSKITQNQYDNGVEGGDGNLTKVTRPVDDTSAHGRITEMQYDWRDRLTTTIINDDTDDFHIIATLDNLGRTTVLDTMRDDSGLVLIAKSETMFDTRGRVYRTRNYAVDDSGDYGNWLESNTWYDANNNVIKSLPPGSRAFSKTTYDAINRPTNSYYGYFDDTGSDDPQSLDDNVIFTQSQTFYDAASNATFTTSKRRFHNTSGTGALSGPGGSPPKSRDSYMAMWYDGIGRSTEVANYGTNGGTAPNRPTSAPPTSDIILVSQSVYNIRGEMEDAVDPLDKIYRTEYDDAGRVTKVTMNYGQSPTEVTSTEYEDGLMSKQIADNSTTGNQETTYTYGVTLTNSEIASNDLLQSVTYPDSGEVIYEYNRQGDQITMTDQNGTVHDYEYDQLGRRFKDKVTVGTDVDDSVQRIETAYDDRMRVEKVTSYDAPSGGNVTSQVQYQYNDFSQVMTEYQQHGEEVNTSTSPNVQYAYEGGSDNNIRPTSMTYPDGRALAYQYGDEDDANDQLSRIQNLDFDSGGVVDYNYLGLSQVVIQKYTEPSTDVEYTLATGTGDDPYDGGMDRFGRIIKLRWQRGTSILINYNYTYDRVGNKKSLQDNPVSPQSFYAGELYGYDDLYRLESYDRGQLSGGTISSPNLTQDWTLDQTGNWINFQQGVVDALNQGRGHNTANEITSITHTVGNTWPTPSYDANGNMTAFPQPENLTSSFDATWDAWNRLTKLESGSNTVAQFGYDGLGRRIIKKKYASGNLDETRHYYLSSSSQVLEERVDSETDAAQQFVWGLRFVDDLVLRDRDSDSDGDLDERLYALADPRFSVLAIVDETGSVQERYSYDGYGRTSVLTPSYTNRTTSSFNWEFRYTGRRLDLETALYFFRARFYHAELGRFISRDLAGYIDGFNLYRASFVPGAMDPLGFKVECLTIGGEIEYYGGGGITFAICFDECGGSALIGFYKIKFGLGTSAGVGVLRPNMDCIKEFENDSPGWEGTGSIGPFTGSVGGDFSSPIPSGGSIGAGGKIPGTRIPVGGGWGFGSSAGGSTGDLGSPDWMPDPKIKGISFNASAGYTNYFIISIAKPRCPCPKQEIPKSDPGCGTVVGKEICKDFCTLAVLDKFGNAMTPVSRAAYERCMDNCFQFVINNPGKDPMSHISNPFAGFD